MWEVINSKTIILHLITGIVPIFCEEIFKGIDEKKQGGDEAQFEVLFNFLEFWLKVFSKFVAYLNFKEN